MALAAAGTAAASAMIGGIQSLQQGNYEYRMSKQSAAMDIEAARESVFEAQREARALYRQFGKVKGDQRAALAANGIDPDFGAGARLEADTNMYMREDAEALQRNASERTRGFVIRSQNTLAAGRAARSAGRSAMVGSALGAASSMLGGVNAERAYRDRYGKPSPGVGESLMSGFQQHRILRARIGG